MGPRAWCGLGVSPAGVRNSGEIHCLAPRGVVVRGIKFLVANLPVGECGGKDQVG